MWTLVTNYNIETWEKLQIYLKRHNKMYTLWYGYSDWSLNVCSWTGVFCNLRVLAQLMVWRRTGDELSNVLMMAEVNVIASYKHCHHTMGFKHIWFVALIDNDI